MSMYTRCAHCETYFKVSREQLQVSSGQVRCGRCDQVFDAFASLTSQLPAADVKAAGRPATPPASAAPLPRPGTGPFSRPIVEQKAPVAVDIELPEASSAPDVEQERPEALTLPDDLFGAGAAGADRRRGWPWTAACALLALGLIVQVLYFFATELAVRLPQLRPQLVEACRWLPCTVALARVPDLLFIEASDLQVLNAARAGEVLLTATIRNRAPLTQALPLIELTLTDALNQPAARKVFYPADYLDKSQDQGQGIGANQEILIKLYLDTGNIKPAGYRLYLFFA
jgi:predicted Zn finger-like uncharacterized protein